MVSSRLTAYSAMILILSLAAFQVTSGIRLSDDSVAEHVGQERDEDLSGTLKLVQNVSSLLGNDNLPPRKNHTSKLPIKSSSRSSAMELRKETRVRKARQAPGQDLAAKLNDLDKNQDGDVDVHEIDEAIGIKSRFSIADKECEDGLEITTIDDCRAAKEWFEDICRNESEDMEEDEGSCDVEFYEKPDPNETSLPLGCLLELDEPENVIWNGNPPEQQASPNGSTEDDEFKILCLGDIPMEEANCRSHSECAADETGMLQINFCNVNGDCEACTGCHYCHDGIDGTCGGCDAQQYPTEEKQCEASTPQSSAGTTPTPEPTMKPTPDEDSSENSTEEDSSLAPTPAPTKCFPSSSSVHSEDRGLVHIDSLRQGDFILVVNETGHTFYDEISFYSLADPGRKHNEFLVVKTSNRVLRVTADHHLPTGLECCRNLKTMAELRVGDLVWTVQASDYSATPEVIEAIDSVVDDGFHSPVMLHGGHPVVDGVVTAFDDLRSVAMSKRWMPFLSRICTSWGICGAMSKTVKIFECVTKAECGDRVTIHSRVHAVM